MQVKHLQGELERVTLKLRQADKSAAANQLIMVRPANHGHTAALTILSRLLAKGAR